MTTIKSLLHQAGQQLKAVSDTPMLDAEIILAHFLQVSRSFLYAHSDDTIEDYAQFEILIQQRMQGHPIAYLTRQKEFYGLNLYVNEFTLIPRPETELLVDIILQRLDESPHAILDLGTGSGAISVALAQARPTWHITAVDSSREALKVAQKNAQTFHLNNITFLQSDWFLQLEPQQFDVIVSNPPYIEQHDLHLSRGDVRFEPKNALISGEDGLTDIKKIIDQAPYFLTSDGFLLLEHGYQQQEAVDRLFKARHFQNIQHFQDLAGLPRASLGYQLSSDRFA